MNADVNDSYHLDRFVEAQANVFSQARAELAAGEKRSHWMWFIFPQVHGLGASATAQHFAITGLEEACAYLEHPLLGSRLRDCTTLVNALEGHSPSEIFGYPDDLKFHSSLTLFARAALHGPCRIDAANQVFAAALDKYFAGQPDKNTLERL